MARCSSAGVKVAWVSSCSLLVFGILLPLQTSARVEPANNERRVSTTRLRNGFSLPAR